MEMHRRLELQKKQKNLRVTTIDEEHTQDDRQRGQRVECIPWHRIHHDKYVQNGEEMVSFVESY
jgi:hypothetical protein